MIAERLNEIMRERYSYISYDNSLAEKFLKDVAPQTEEEETIAWHFADYLVSQGLADEVEF